MCLFTNPSEICNHAECISFQLRQNVFPLSSSNMISTMNILLQHQSLALSDLIQKNQMLNSHLSILEDSLKLSQKSQIAHSEFPMQVENPLSWTAANENFNFFIKLRNDFPEAVYKEKGFSLVAFISDQEGQQLFPPGILNFIVELFTVENPPKVLKVNISGKKILRGTVEAPLENGEIRFSNVVVNEVTSHYPNNKFCFVVSCLNSDGIKPLVVNGVTVRARKHKASDIK